MYVLFVFAKARDVVVAAVVVLASVRSLLDKPNYDDVA